MDTKPYKIARINLETGTVHCWEPDPALVEAYLGGRGLGLCLLRMCTDPAPLLFLTGPMTDQPNGGRYCAAARSPVNGQPMTPSSGSAWGTALKKAGWDGVLLEGTAPDWVSVGIDGDTVRVAGAAEALGMSAAETEAWMAGYTTLAIGPAGEQGVYLSAIYCGKHHAFSRGGIGAVMGAKRLKAIGVRSEEPVLHACARCPVRCAHAEGRDDPCADAYGLDAMGLSRMIKTAQALRSQGIAQIPDWDRGQWAAQISSPATELTRLAGRGAEALQKAYSVPETAQEKPAAKKGLKNKIPGEMSAVLDSMGCCLFSAARFQPKTYAEWLSLAAGRPYTEEELFQIGARIGAL